MFSVYIFLEQASETLHVLRMYMYIRVRVCAFGQSAVVYQDHTLTFKRCCVVVASVSMYGCVRFKHAMCQNSEYLALFLLLKIQNIIY